MKPEEVTYKIKINSKNYLIQIKNDKGQFISKKEALDFIKRAEESNKLDEYAFSKLENNYNMAIASLEELSYNLLQEENKVARLKNIIYITIAASCALFISFIASIIF